MIRLLALLALLLGPAATSAAADDLGSCRFHLSRSTWTIAYGAYEGSLPSSIRLPPSHHSANRLRRIEVTVPKKDVPLFLILTAYESVEWDLKIEPGAQIAAVLAMGYYAQFVRNLPERVPYGFSTRSDGAGDECPKTPIYAYGSGDDYSKLTTLISDEFSRKVNQFHGNYGAECLPKGCVAMRKPKPRGFWNTIFWAPTKAEPPPAGGPPLRASTRLLD